MRPGLKCGHGTLRLLSTLSAHHHPIRSTASVRAEYSDASDSLEEIEERGLMMAMVKDLEEGKERVQSQKARTSPQLERCDEAALRPPFTRISAHRPIRSMPSVWAGPCHPAARRPNLLQGARVRAFTLM